MATDVIRYINTESTAGGDGTTNATTGANRAYATMLEWNTAEAADLVSANENHTVYCCGTAADEGGVTIELDSAWTTGAGNGITIAGNRDEANGWHTGKFSTAHYRLSAGGPTAADPVQCMVITVPYVRVIGIQIYPNDASGFSWGGVSINSLGPVTLLSNIIKQGYSTGAGVSGTGIYIAGGVSGSNHYIINNIIIGFFNAATPSASYGFWRNSVNADAFLYCNTIIGCGRGASSTGGTVAKDNILQDCVEGFYPSSGYFDVTSDYNISDIAADAPGANSKQATVKFASAAAGNYHLAADDTEAKDWAENLYADSDYAVTTDIDGDERLPTGNFDAGADSYTPPPAAYIAPELSIFDFAEDGLAMSIYISLFTDKRILFADGEPETKNDRRGWWADNPLNNGDYIGSVNWRFLAKKIIDPDTINGLNESTTQALDWLIEDKVAKEITVTTVRKDKEGLVSTIDITMPDDSENNFKIVWEGVANGV